ncbi:MAG: nucleotidyltransferase domain-containing protein [Candidatus Doudnabacteria bacterium]|nr:nucleotidyltransferase domain-containing protein [Candidatus Doudnabacteria bacterium]
MLKDRILSTLKFFDLQDCPLTLLELHKFLLPEPEILTGLLDERGEIKNDAGPASPQVNISQVQACLENECQTEACCLYGYYALAGRRQIISGRWENYCYGIKREQLIAKFLPGVRHLPFIKGVSVLGSQALGMPREGSDIDLLILVDSGRIGLARIFITSYFQMLGLRRHGRKVANRFCLNHYVAADKILNSDRNLYTASEYFKMRPAISGRAVADFQKNNFSWMNRIFGNAPVIIPVDESVSVARNFFERLLGGKTGGFLERWVKKAQYGHINRGEFIVVSEDELSFHPNNRKQQLFNSFFDYVQRQRPKPPSLIPEVN